MGETAKTGDPFTCQKCEETFERARSDSEAMDEATALHPDEAFGEFNEWFQRTYGYP